MKLGTLLLVVMSVLMIGCKDIHTEYNRTMIDMLHPTPQFYKEIEKLFPLLKVLDTQIDWTSGIRWYEVEHIETEEKFKIFRQRVYNEFGRKEVENKWVIRKNINGKHWFRDIGSDKWYCDEYDVEKRKWIRIYRD